jgi:glycosyltransferase involved in cell wall biosynthesis
MHDFEIIAVNDGSQDNSLDILNKYAKKDSRVSVISKKNGGASTARNCGIEKARGKYMMFLDADDNIAHEMITTMVAAIEKQAADMVVCGIKFITFRNGREVSSVDVGVTPLPTKLDHEDHKTYTVKLLGIDGRLYNPSNKVFRSEIIKEHHLRFETGLDFGEDLTFNLHYLAHADKIYFINQPLYIYNFNVETGTFGKSSLIYKNRQKNYRELLGFAGKKRTDAMNDYLGWIKYYWFYSFALVVCSSRMKLKKRMNLLAQAAKTEQFQPAKSPEHIGRKKYLVEKILGVISKSAIALWLFMSVSSFIKTNRLFAKLWKRLAISLTPNK